MLGQGTALAYLKGLDMKNTVYSKETFGQEISFDEFNLIITALKITGSERWQRIIRFSHVMRDKATGKMLETVKTQLFFDDLMAIRDMDLKLRYDEQLLEKSLDAMEDFTTDMLERDKAFYRGISKKVE